MGLHASRLEQAMTSAGLDAVITTSPELASYLAGAYSPIHRLLPERPVVVVWPSRGEPVIVCAAVEHTFVSTVSGRDRVTSYAGESELRPAIAAAVREAGLAGARIGVDYPSMPVGIYRGLLDDFPRTTFDDAGHALGWTLAVKPGSAVAALEKAATCTDAAEWSALGGFGGRTGGRTGGGTEIELANSLRTALIAHGADDISFLTLGGSRGRATPQSPPSDRTLVAGELVRFDMGGNFAGWMSDLARTVAVGASTANQRSNYSFAWDTLCRHTERLRPGARAGELFAAVAADFAAAGVDYVAPHVGHGIGYGVHEWPILAPGSDAELEPGMVLASEVIFRIEGGETYHLEECVEVTEQAPRIISRSRPLPEDLPVLR